MSEWRVGNHYGIHVYEGSRPVATFHNAFDAQAAVEAVNHSNSALLGEIARLRTHYQSGSAFDIARRQMLDHFEAFAKKSAEVPA